MRLRELRMPPPVTLTGRDDWLDLRKKSWSPVEDRGGVMTPVHTYQDMLIKRQFIFEVPVSCFHGFYKVQMHRHINSTRLAQDCEQHDVWPD